MELDELRASWKQSTDNPQFPNNNIMDIIRNKKTGPVGILKKSFRRKIISLTAAIIIISWVLTQDSDRAFPRLLFMLMLFVWTVTIIYFIYSYRVLSRINEMDAMVKPRLEAAITKLENSLEWRVRFISITNVLIVIYLEVWMHYGSQTGMESWMRQSIFTRLLAYGVCLFVFHFMARIVLGIKYGKYISYLKHLVGQMQ